MKQKLIIFDCDGVLVDSEYVASRVFSEAMLRYGYPITTEESIRRFTGVNERDAREAILKEASIDIPEDYWDQQQPQLHQAYKLELKPLMRPVLEVLQKLQQPRCVASNSSSGYIIKCLTLSEQFAYFSEQTIFSAQQVSSPKPAPDLYLFAAEQMGFAPSDCIVIEDSPAGAQAAIAAGMDLLLFLGGSHANYHWYHDNVKAYNKPIATSCSELLQSLYLLGL